MTLLNKIILTTVAAGAILVVAILPAEYGIDPTGLGSTLGLVNIAKNDATETELSQEKNRTLASQMPVLFPDSS